MIQNKLKTNVTCNIVRKNGVEKVIVDSQYYDEDTFIQEPTIETQYKTWVKDVFTQTFKNLYDENRK